MIGLESDRFAALGDPICQFALAHQRDAEIVVGVDEIGLEPQRFTVLGDGVVEIPLITKGVAEVAVNTGAVRSKPQRLAEFSDCSVEVVLLIAQNCAEVVVSHEVMGIDLQSRSILGARLL